MARYRCRGILANRQSVIVKVTADDVYQAAWEARKELLASGADLRQIQQLVIRPLENAKSQVYWGKVPQTGAKSNRGAHFRKAAQATEAPAAVEALPDGNIPTETAQPEPVEAAPQGRRNRR